MRSDPPRVVPDPVRLRSADGLTAARLLVGVALVSVRPSPGTAVLLLAAAWVSDAADGMLARAAGAEGRLGRLDPGVDTAVAVGAVWYLGEVGFVAAVPSRVAVAFLVAVWLTTGVLAVQMLLAAVSYGGFLWWSVVVRAPGWWLLPLVALGVLVLEWSRFVGELVPRFLGGWTGLLRPGDRRYGRDDAH